MPDKSTYNSLMLCSGKHCLKKQRRLFDRLERAAKLAGLTTNRFSCIGTCAGPTAVLYINGTHHVYERLAKPSSQDDLINFAAGQTSKPSSRLKQRQVTGKKAKRAARKLQLT